MGHPRGSLGKLARDISLHAKEEIAEVRAQRILEKEAPLCLHKRNPVGCMRMGRRQSVACLSVLASLLCLRNMSEGQWLGNRNGRVWWDLFSLAREASAEMAEMAEGLEGFRQDAGQFRSDERSRFF